jgi:hypothetical protein
MANTEPAGPPDFNRISKIRDEAVRFQSETRTMTVNMIKAKSEHFIKKYEYLHKESIHLFKKICEKELDDGHFSYMLQCLSQMERNQINQFDASAKFGTRVYDAYIKPKLDGIKKDE